MKSILLLLDDEHFAALREIAERRGFDGIDSMVLQLTYYFRAEDAQQRSDFEKTRTPPANGLSS